MLLANGDSFTHGYYLDNLESAWPFQLGRLINQPVVNLSMGGGSNQRIFRTTIDYLSTSTPDYLVIGWAGIGRYELPTANTQYVRITPAGAQFNQDRPDNLDPATIKEFYYKNLHNSYLNTVDLLNYIITLQNLCKGKNIKYLFFNAYATVDFQSVLDDCPKWFPYQEEFL